MLIGKVGQTYQLIYTAKNEMPILRKKNLFQGNFSLNQEILSCPVRNISFLVKISTNKKNILDLRNNILSRKS